MFEHFSRKKYFTKNVFQTYFKFKDSAGGAWCPRDPVGPRPESHAQWLGVNMSSTQVVTKVLTQGRYAGGQVRSTPFLCAVLRKYSLLQGQEYTMAYRIMYWRPGMAAFKEYRDSVGRNVSIVSYLSSIILPCLQSIELLYQSLLLLLLYR